MLEVDPSVLERPENEDYDSAGYDTSTASLTSSVNEYIFENGRRYHAYYGPDKYLLPTDEKEQDRLDLNHEITRMVWDDKLHEAPLQEPHRILDIGTGTGIWAIDMADKYPMAEVIGIDLSPIQPDWVPANCRFEVDDAMMEWTFKNDFFDLIHCRNIASGVSDWNHLVTQMMRCTIPGGYVELCEYSITAHSDDDTMKHDHGTKICMDTLREAMSKMGRPAQTLESMRIVLEKAGFEDVQALEAKEPLGPWPKDPRQKKIGAMSLLNCETGFESYAMAAFTRVLGMEVDKAHAICDAARTAVRNKNYHIYTKSVAPWFARYGDVEFNQQTSGIVGIMHRKGDTHMSGLANIRTSQTHGLMGKESSTHLDTMKIYLIFPFHEVS
ncbi:S-adenosyl-L-methionine-dependent methyltransferase [Pyronema omphalodes]|nr:S-adenosyl-L-methionine-dependent methyltransferase [Pyronema omphalodes]